ncbi:hypothetical protein HU200_001981 [Digitaria exilis]|uniref:LOB domain-containing protein n=1 Tax=Digitaria exilis TaxID=1010633 RepID=A0A835FW84_9POAL|nr:hypothetical protein HU200_001981 [Digitaria exilis]CAB3476436.1 unnamed protein product [Digitaria exilis]
MRMSCNGCRVLRKGCSDNCAIRPCLQWIRSPDAQGNATVFLAKFYGRTGLINLITSGPDHLRPAIFRSLLYEACGRMLNPVYGSVGLLWSGNWQLCQTAVESVLRGMPIAPPPAAAAAAVPPLQTCDIRHVARRRQDHGHGGAAVAAAAASLHRMANSSRAQFKRHRAGSGGIELVFSQPSSAAMLVDVQPLSWAPRRQASHDAVVVPETDSNTSVDTVDVSHVSQSEPEPQKESDEHADGLDLTLGLPPTMVHKIQPSEVDDVRQELSHRSDRAGEARLGGHRF